MTLQTIFMNVMMCFFFSLFAYEYDFWQKLGNCNPSLDVEVLYAAYP